MAHPHVQIAKPNQCNRLLEHLDANLPEFKTQSGIVGITLNGGLSRGYGDHLSEIDISFYLDTNTFQRWQRGNAPYGNGIQRINGELYDIKFVDFTEEDVATWSSDARWDAAYAQILYDPYGHIRQLLDKNETYRPSPSDASGVMFGAWWYFKLAGDIWIYRDDPLQAHFMLNQALTELIKAIHIANREFIPHEKWLIHMSRSLDWTPTNWIQRLTQVMCEISPTQDNVINRQRYIEQLWAETDEHIVSMLDEPYPLNITQKRFYDLLLMLVKNESTPIADWENIANLSLLNSAPFNSCVTVVEDTIVFDREKCSELTQEEVYSWHYAIVEAIQAILSSKK